MVQCSSIQPIRNKRGARVDKRWPNGIVYYDFHTSVGSELRRIIERAIEEFEQKTCLNFQLAPVAPDCIMFTANGDGCTSSVGKVGGLQYITLPNLGSLGTCQTHGITLHEIGHAIGFWHEQSRPDRDHYVTTHLENIKNSQHHNFGIREDVNYQGVTYDYHSIMHYSQYAYSKNGKKSIIVKRTPYNAQGKPKVGQRLRLSDSDALQINRMYNCPSNGYRKDLRVKIKRATNLPNKDTAWYGFSDPYACVEAVDSWGRRSTKCTTYISDASYPTWYQNLDFGRSTSGWRFFVIKILDRDWGTGDDILLTPQTIWVSPGFHNNVKFCASRETCVYFDYHLAFDGNECNPNPCIRGTCHDFFANYYCQCPSTYYGGNCQHRRRTP